MSKEVLTQRSEITTFLSQLLISTRLTGIGKHYASEVTLDYGHKKGEPKRIDFVQFKPQNTYSISGIERGEFICPHVKGETYGDKLCYGELIDPCDAYEFGFVAIPKQPEVK